MAPTVVIAVALVLYSLLQRSLRYRKRDALISSFGYGTSRPLGEMTFDDASSIYHDLAEMEFPFSMLNASALVLLRTYGIPSMSKLLIATNQITSPETRPKRLADTGVLMFEIEGSPPSSTRWLEAVARTNRIHDIYRKAGKISNDDMLYTLSLHAGQPLKWVAQHEWRQLTQLEKAAIGTFWKGIGDAMHIAFDVLPSSRSGWDSGLQWLEEILEWAEVYERASMTAHIDGNKLAVATLEYILWPVPTRFRPQGYAALGSLLDDCLTAALILPPTPPLNKYLTTLFLTIRKYLVRHIFLPRPSFWRVSYFTKVPNKLGRYHSTLYGGLPFYIADTFAWRWNLQAWIFWALGKPVPGDGGGKYLPEGYDVKEVGPRAVPVSGREEGKELGREIMARGACPFRFAAG